MALLIRSTFADAGEIAARFPRVSRAAVFEAPGGAARGAAGAGAGAWAGVALQPRRSAVGAGVPGVAGDVRAALGGKPGAAEAASGRELGVCGGRLSHDRGVG